MAKMAEKFERKAGDNAGSKKALEALEAYVGWEALRGGERWTLTTPSPTRARRAKALSTEAAVQMEAIAAASAAAAEHGASLDAKRQVAAQVGGGGSGEGGID